MKRPFRKKGSVILLTLLVLIGIFIIAAIFINLAMAYEVANRAQDAADMGAKVRAQSVDIAMKERLGYIEVFHAGSSNYPGDNIPNRSSIPQNEVGYNQPIYNTNSMTYLNTMQDADITTRDAVADYMNANIGVNTTGTRQVTIVPENICISVRALPAGEVGTMTFTCTARVNGQNVVVEAKDIKVNGTDNPINVGPSGERVMNVVFVGLAFEHKHFIYEGVQSALNGNDQSTWDPAPVRVNWSLAYPQIDSCTATKDCE